MLSVTSTPLLQATLADVRLGLEVIAAALAVRAYRRNPTRPLALFRAAFLCPAVTHFAILAFAGVTSFVFPQLQRFSWIYYANPLAVITFLALSILAFLTLLRESTPNVPQTSNQSQQPTASGRTTSLSND